MNKTQWRALQLAENAKQRAENLAYYEAGLRRLGYSYYTRVGVADEMYHTACTVFTCVKCNMGWTRAYRVNPVGIDRMVVTPEELANASLLKEVTSVCPHAERYLAQLKGLPYTPKGQRLNVAPAEYQKLRLAADKIIDLALLGEEFELQSVGMSDTIMEMFGETVLMALAYIPTHIKVWFQGVPLGLARITPAEEEEIPITPEVRASVRHWLERGEGDRLIVPASPPRFAWRTTVGEPRATIPIERAVYRESPTLDFRLDSIWSEEKQGILRIAGIDQFGRFVGRNG